MGLNGRTSRRRSRISSAVPVPYSPFPPSTLIIPAFHPVIPAKAGIQRAADANHMALSDIASAIIGDRGNPRDIQGDKRIQ